MKKVFIKSMILGVILLCVAASATPSLGAMPKTIDQQTPRAMDVIWSDNFDSYTNGQVLDGTEDDGGWKGWDNSAAAGATVVTTQSRSSPNSVEVKGATDLVHEYRVTAGACNYTLWIYVPADFSGQSYFILLSDYEDGAGSANLWAVQLRFDSDLQVVESEFDSISLPLITGQWVEVRCAIDLDADSLGIYYNGELLLEKAWTATTNNDGSGALAIDAVDLYANSATAVYYDDMALEGPAVQLEPELTIGDLAGGFGVSATITNTGDADATNVAWKIALDGGLIILGKETTGTIATLAPAASEPIKSSLILGFGRTTITITATCDEGASDDLTGSGFVFLVFVLGVK